jgi:hypothetical protein
MLVRITITVSIAGAFIGTSIYLLATHQLGGLATAFIWIGIVVLWQGLYKNRRMLRAKLD